MDVFSRSLQRENAADAIGVSFEASWIPLDYHAHRVILISLGSLVDFADMWNFLLYPAPSHMIYPTLAVLSLRFARVLPPIGNASYCCLLIRLAF